MAANSKHITKRGHLKKTAIAVCVVLGAAIAWVYVQYRTDITQQWNRVSTNSQIAETPCGPIEYATAGSGLPLLVVHGAGGGFDQGLDFAQDLPRRDVKVIAMSRFGYLRTPLPDDASAAAQADAHLCLINALGISRAAIAGASAGAPSAMQFAIRHPERTAALFLMVPAAYRPDPTAPDSRATHVRSMTTPPWTAFLFDTALKSDLLFWLTIRLAPDITVGSILATPPEVVKSADRLEQQRVQQIMAHLLPITSRRLGLINDAKVTSTLPRYDLDRIQAPTLIVSLKDDGYGTYAGARYSADHISGARFIGYDQGGHVWVGHNQEILEEATRFLHANK
jgi:2-hydroxy-6-oxonona-2,4-dienedioate hydrolase